MTLSTELIETLVNLVESRLLSLSSSKQDFTAEYRDLQDCRYALLALAARRHGATAPCTPAKRSGHLTAIPGGKA